MLCHRGHSHVSKSGIHLSVQKQINPRLLYRHDLRQPSHATVLALDFVSQATAGGGHGTQATGVGDGARAADLSSI